MNLSPTSIEDVAKIRALADGTRRTIYLTIAATGPMRPTDIAAALNRPLQTVSYALVELARVGLLTVTQGDKKHERLYGVAK